MDAGYSGEEADQVAQMLERQAYEDYQKHLEEKAAEDAHFQVIGEAVELLRSEGFIVGTKEEVAAALAREDGMKIWWCAFKETADTELTCRRGIPEHHKRCGPHLLIPLGETPQPENSAAQSGGE